MKLTTTIILFCMTLVHCQPTAEVYQSQQVAASLARKVVSDAGRGTILTLMDESVSSEFSGYPFGIMEYYSDKCSDDGNLLLFMSDLQMSARNMHRNSKKVAFSVNSLKDYNPSWGNHSTPVEQPRFTLFGEIRSIPDSEKSMECFSRVHPEAKPWNKFHDFNFYEFQVHGMYYVGGFGGINYIGWIPAKVYHNATPQTPSKLLRQD
ncbi:unnamed protein product [Mucor hiemalis]